MKKYEVWNANPKGEDGIVPVVIISDNADAVVAVPLSTNGDEERLASHALVFVDGPSAIAIACCEQVMIVETSSLIKRIGCVSEELDRSALNRAMLASFAVAA